MKKVTLLLCSFLLIFGVGVYKVSAKPVEPVSMVYSLDRSITDANCEGTLGSPDDPDSLAYFLQEIFNIFKFAAPLLVLVMTIIDFIKAITSQDKDMIFKVAKKTGIRIVLAIVLFFVPTFLNMFLSWVGAYSTCGIG